MSAAVGYLFDAFEYWFQFCAAHVAIKIFVVALQVYLDRIKRFAHFRERGTIDESAAYHDGAKALFPRITGNIYHIFGKYRWLIIRKGYDAGLAGRCGSCNLLG